MFVKDTFRLIKKTFNRFFSLVMIVFIGVAFMMGLMSTNIIMRESMDKYNDKYNLQDIQLFSSYGFCDEDINSLKDVDGVNEVFASKMVDTYCTIPNGNVVIARVEELGRRVNEYELIEGRLPEKENEVVVLSSTNTNKGYGIGDKLELYLEKGDLTEKLKNAEFTIVGFVKSPAYTSRVLSTSTLDNRDLNIILYAQNSNFVFDYYTTVYVTIDGAKSKTAFTEEYNEYIDNNINDIEGFAYKQQDYLKEELLAKYTEKIKENEKLLADKKEEGLKKLDDAKKELDEGNIKLIYAEAQIETNKTTLEASERQLVQQEKVLKDSEKQVNDAVKQIEDKTGQSFDTVYNEITAAYYSYITIESQIGQGGIGGNEQIQKQLEQLREEKSNNLQRIAEIDNTELPSVETQIAEKEAEIAQLDNTAPDYEETLERLNEELATLQTQKTDLENEKQTLQARNAAIDALEKLLTESTQIDTDTTLQAILDEFDAQFKEYGFKGTKDAYTQMTLLKNSIAQIETGKQQLVAGRAQIEAGYKQIRDAEYTIAQNKKVYEQGLKDYSEGVLVFNEEIEKAEAEIKKAYQDLEELPDAKWMILKRDSHYSSYMFDNTCKQMKSIGLSLPLLFYLVAALVCMTTMTRLIDEQRGQIGVFRALGFSKEKVISKYVSYALLASLVGSVFGIGFGLITFPLVIYQAWRLMYDLPGIKLLAPIVIVIICILAFSLLMMIVTYFVVRKTLEEVPSQLLRPKAPKNAKAVFLEKIRFIWNKLSFTGKITARNLIRYKTRFFMTVIGVAGCTALLVVGYGIKDSIADIIEIQFKDIFKYNYNLNLENDHEVKAIVEEAKSNLDNETVVPYMQYMTKAYTDGDEATAYAIVVDARESNEIFNFRLTDKKTSTKMTNNGVLVTEKFAKNNGIKAGDYITIESKNGIKAQAKVNEICEMYFQHYIFISEDYYESLFNEPIHYTVVAVNTLDSEILIRQCKQFESVTSLTDFSNMISQFEIMIEALDLIIIVIILTAGSLAFVVLINLTQVNVSERMREIATLKVLGFNDREVNMYIFKEIFLLSFIGSIVGLPLGVVFHHFIMNIINMDMVMFGMNIRILSFTYAFAITIIFTIIVLFFTRKTLRQIEMIESLKSVE